MESSVVLSSDFADGLIFGVCAVSGWSCGQRGRCPSRLMFLLAISGSFLRVVHNSPAALAAGEIRVQKKRIVSDAPEAWIWGCCFMDFSLVCYLKTLPALARQGRAKIEKTAA